MARRRRKRRYLRRGPQDGTGPRGDTPACPMTEAKELTAAKGKFYIEFYSKGKPKRKYYDDLEQAKKDADKIFKETGIMVGIQEK